MRVIASSYAEALLDCIIKKTVNAMTTARAAAQDAIIIVKFLLLSFLRSGFGETGAYGTGCWTPE